jgi:hypothetical protein
VQERSPGVATTALSRVKSSKCLLWLGSSMQTSPFLNNAVKVGGPKFHNSSHLRQCMVRSGLGAPSINLVWSTRTSSDYIIYIIYTYCQSTSRNRKTSVATWDHAWVLFYFILLFYCFVSNTREE